MVQTVKNMTKAHVNAEQTNWDRNLKKLAYAYNTAVNDTIKQTPFEMMFLRKPKIPIDLLIPPINERGRERIDKPETIVIDREQVEILEDVEVELSMPEKAREYLKELNEKMTNCFQIATNQRNLVMDKAKINHDRSIKKMEYKVGDLVLVDHPRIGKGLSHGLAKKYRGPYVIVGKNKNKVDYLIREVGKPKSKMKQLHKSHLKAYFDMGRPSKWLKTREDSKVNKQTQTRTKEFPEINEDSIDRNKKPNQMKKKGPLKLKEPVQKRKPVDLDELSFDERVAHVATQKIQEQQIESTKKHLESEISNAKQYEWQEKLDSSIDLMPDYFDAIKDATPIFNSLPAMVQEAVVDSEHGPMLAYELAKNPEIALKLRTANPLSAAQTLLKLEAKIESRLAESKVPVQTAPKVQSTPSVANTSSQSVTNFWELPMEEIMRQSRNNRGSRFR